MHKNIRLKSFQLYNDEKYCMVIKRKASKNLADFNPCDFAVSLISQLQQEHLPLGTQEAAITV